MTAKLAARPQDWAWSSARAHLAGRDDGCVSVRPLLDRVDSMSAFLAAPSDPQLIYRLEQGSTTGRPAGADAWLAKQEKRIGRPLLPAKRGRKPRAMTAAGGRGRNG